MMSDKIQCGHARLADFSLGGSAIHANHGSYGAVPDVVRAAQRVWRDELEANPCRFFRKRYADLIRSAAHKVAGFLGGDGTDWVFVDNATAAANAVIASLELEPGDEILTTDQVYGAVRKALIHHCDRKGARVVEAPIPVPLGDAGQIIASLDRHITPRTKLAVLDHVASTSAIVFPIEELCALLKTAGVPVFVDGAHAPGMLDLDVPAIGADYYAGNGHKWLCAPHGTGLLWCRKDRQTSLHPLVISHGYGDGFTAEFDWPGTRDPSAWLSVPAAIDYHNTQGGWKLRDRNRALAVEAGGLLAESFGTELAAPPSLFGSMATIRMPSGGKKRLNMTEQLQVALEDRFDVEASFTAIAGDVWLRISASIYNELEDFVSVGRAAAVVMEAEVDGI